MGPKSMAHMPFCKFLLAGNCMRGKDCKFRHTGPERPLATAYSCEHFGPDWVINRTPLTTIVDNIVKTTFAPGLVPLAITEVSTLEPETRVYVVTSALEVSWYVPTRNIWLHFTSRAAAQRTVKALNGIETRGTKLRCVMARSQNRRIHPVQLRTVPEKIDRGHLRSLLPEKPARIILGKLLYDPLIAAADIIKNKIKASTSRDVQDSEICAVKNKLKSRLKLEFYGSPNLSALKRELDGQQMTEFGGSQIFATERMHVVISISGRAYDSYGSALKALARNTYKADHVQIHIDGPAAQNDQKREKRAHITLITASREAAIRTKASIDAILAQGLVPRLQNLTSNKPVQLRKNAQASLKQTHRIRLTKTSNYRHVIKVGLAAAKEALGDDAVFMDDESDPPAVVVTGNAEMLRKVQKAMFPDRQPKVRKPKRKEAPIAGAQGGALPAPTKPTPNANPAEATEPRICEMCFDEDCEIIRMPGCQHACCRECFDGYCTVNTTFPLRCFGQDCNIPLGPQFLHHNLSSASFESLTRAALHEHLSHQPEQWLQCPGTGCCAYYRTNVAESAELICPTCFTVVCTNCKIEQHFGETCEDYQDRISSNTRKFEEWLAQGNAKRCKCGVVIQKIEGCDHMRCTKCKIHFCYRCGFSADTDSAVYRHLDQVHGGYGDAEAEADMQEIDAVHFDARDGEEREVLVNGQRMRQLGGVVELEIPRWPDFAAPVPGNIWEQPRDIADAHW